MVLLFTKHFPVIRNTTGRMLQELAQTTPGDLVSGCLIVLAAVFRKKHRKSIAAQQRITEIAGFSPVHHSSITLFTCARTGARSPRHSEKRAGKKYSTLEARR